MGPGFWLPVGSFGGGQFAILRGITAQTIKVTRPRIRDVALARIE